MPSEAREQFGEYQRAASDGPSVTPSSALDPWLTVLVDRLTTDGSGSLLLVDSRIVRAHDPALPAGSTLDPESGAWTAKLPVAPGSCLVSRGR